MIVYLPQVELKLTTSARHQLVIEFVRFPEETYNHVWLRLAAEQEEHLYGAGEQFTYFNLKGHKFQIWTREQGNNTAQISITIT